MLSFSYGGADRGAYANDTSTPLKVVGETVEPYTKEMPKHKKNPDVGTKLTTFSGELYLAFDDAKDLSVGEEVLLLLYRRLVNDCSHVYLPFKGYLHGLGQRDCRKNPLGAGQFTHRLY